MQRGELQISLEKEQSRSLVRQQRPAQDAAQRRVGTCHPHGAHWKPQGRRDNWAFKVLDLLRLELQPLPPCLNCTCSPSWLDETSPGLGNGTPGHPQHHSLLLQNVL